MDQTEQPCPLADAVASIGGKWKILILCRLMQADTLRFSELKRHVGKVSEKVLTSQLKEMIADGYVERRQYPEVPPRVEYGLTRRGKTLVPVLMAIYDWSVEHFRPKVIEKA